jgi:hypothetical protein
VIAQARPRAECLCVFAPLNISWVVGAGGRLRGSRKASEAIEFDEDGEPKVGQEVSASAIVGDRSAIVGDSRR